VRIVWDDSKNAANRRKHGVSFEEASALFTDGDEYLEIFDETHSEEEDRFVAIGPIARGLVLVAYAEGDNDAVRIMSARRATKREALLYRFHIGVGGS
jgi:hypothetical protein